MHLDGEAGIGGVHAPQQAGQIVADHVVADADREAALLGRERADRRLMRGDQIARGGQEDVAVGREPHEARRAVDQAAAELLLEPLDLQADRRLRRVHRLGGAGEALEVGDQDEGLDGFEVEGGHGAAI